MYKRVKQKFTNNAPECWWGDDVDVRFHLIEVLKNVKGRRVLDVGCNIGVILSEVDDSNIKYGVDIERKYIEIALNLDYFSTFWTDSMFDTPFRDSYFDIVIAAHVIPGCDFKVEKRKTSLLQFQMMSEIFRVLRKNGVLYLTTPNRGHQAYWSSPKMSYTELLFLLLPYFETTIYGYNPIPFIPPRVLGMIPGIRKILKYLMKKKWLVKISKAFFVKGIKKGEEAGCFS